MTKEDNLAMALGGLFAIVIGILVLHFYLGFPTDICFKAAIPTTVVSWIILYLYVWTGKPRVKK